MASLHEALSWAPTRYGGALAMRAQESVQVVTLDEVIVDCLERHDHRGVLLKLDTQGHDIDVLMGPSDATLARIDAVQAELSVKLL